ncbi:unnamed protein product [Arabidopsis thaliana]|uniref:(thale cress) hypothetical protein n=1 Tax=Arabidopsis thaliana TaxID=3702 RepID=A0A7G2EMV9_ARATH|nr:unnamed protein product [Arabidopsis thaliana]
MASGKLPWELEEEILCRLPPGSLVRLRSVCKHWNNLYNDKWFIKKSLGFARPQFIILAGFKIYSIGTIGLDVVDPKIEVRELACQFHFEAEKWAFTRITACNGLLFRDFWNQGVTIWNPWLRQVGWIEYKEDKDFRFCGVGYDAGKPEKGYKIFGYFNRFYDTKLKIGHRFAIFECASQAFKFIDSPEWPTLAGRENHSQEQAKDTMLQKLCLNDWALMSMLWPLMRLNRYQLGLYGLKKLVSRSRSPLLEKLVNSPVLMECEGEDEKQLSSV